MLQVVNRADAECQTSAERSPSPQTHHPRAPMAVPDHPRTHSAAQAAGTGAGMTAVHDETAGRRGGDGTGLRGSATDAPTQGVLGSVMAWQRPGTPSTEQKECLRISPSAIGSSERPMAVVGRRPSGKSRLSSPMPRQYSLSP